MSVASSSRSEGNRSVRDSQGFKVSKWAPAPRGALAAAVAHRVVDVPHAPAQHVGRRVIGLTHNYDVTADRHVGDVAVHVERPAHRIVEHIERAPVSVVSNDLREREFIDEETYSHIEHVPVRIQQRVVHRTREVPKPVPVPHYIEVPKPFPVEKIVEVPKYIEKRVEVPVEVERIVEVPVERIVEKIVHVDRPVHVVQKVEVPVREEIIREVERPVRDAVPVHVPDPRQSAAIASLQRELEAAHAELSNMRGGASREVIHRGTTHHHHRAPAALRREIVVREEAPMRSIHTDHHHIVQPYERDFVGLRGRVPVDDILLHQHPTAKWGRQHDIPGRRVRRQGRNDASS